MNLGARNLFGVLVTVFSIFTEHKWTGKLEVTISSIPSTLVEGEEATAQ